jgi:hypothetical protein
MMKRVDDSLDRTPQGCERNTESSMIEKKIGNECDPEVEVYDTPETYHLGD